MASPEPQVVLLSLVGQTPAVLTETIWALAHQSSPCIPDRVVVVTTKSGGEKLTKKLFAEKCWAGFKVALAESGADLSNKLRFGPIPDSIRVIPNAQRDRELDDIRSLEDNEAVAEFLMEVVRGFTENDSIRLVVSLAGGRKTTSALLHSVMTLLGRAQDTITHIIVEEPWAFHPDFLYPGCDGTFIDPQSGETISSREAQLYLTEVPFVPLRYLFKRDLQRSAGSYLQLVQQLRARALNIDNELTVVVDTEAGELRINERVVRLSPNEFLFYLFFARRAAAGERPIESFAELDGALESLRTEFLRKDDFGHWAGKALPSTFDANEDSRKWASNIRTTLRKNEFDSMQIDRLVPRRGYLAIEIPAEQIEVA